MTFTYSQPFDDIARVRFHTGDTDSVNHFLSDEVIEALMTENDDDWQKAALAAVEYIITQLLTPGFTADWLKVDNAAAIAGYERLLKRLQSKFGISDEVITLTSVQSIRMDGGYEGTLSDDEGEYSL